MRERTQPLMTWLRDALMIGAALAGVLSFMSVVLFAGVMSIYGQPLSKIVQDWLGITAIKEQIAEMSGANRVTQQPDGMSYVREPVFVGQPIELVLIIGRTPVGAACILIESIPLFVGDDGQTYAGQPRRPSQQLGPSPSRRELVLPYPERLPPGRTALELQLEYDCAGVTVFELTEPVSFTVQEPETTTP